MAVELWGRTAEASKGAHPNDFVYWVGILLLESNRDYLDVLHDKRKCLRHVMDDPSFRKPMIFNKLAEQFNNKDLVIGNPKSWKEANHDMIEGYDAVDPNDLMRILL